MRVATASARPAAASGSLSQRRSAAGASTQPARGGAAAAAAGRRRGPAPRRALPEEPFNEGAAQVRRLMDRDRKELDLDALAASFGVDEPSTPPSSSGSGDAAEPDQASTPRNSFMVNSAASDFTPVSPFGPSSSAPAGSSPFGGAGGGAAKRPFAEPKGLSPNMPMPKADETPWWKQITLTQIVIVASFTTIISLMIGTFFFVLSTGAIRMNE